MKPHLLSPRRDFDPDAEPPPQHRAIIGDLELRALLVAMAAGDEFVFDTATRVVLTSLVEPEEIRYRQDVLADCVAQPAVLRELYDLAVGALEDRRNLWSLRSNERPQVNLSGAISEMEAALPRLRRLRSIADAHGASFRSLGMTTFFQTLQRELGDEYLALVGEHLKRLRFRRGYLLSARLDWGNTGIDYVLRAPLPPARGLRHLGGRGDGRSYAFKVPTQPEGPARELSEIVNRGVNLVANAAARSADHLFSFFTVLRRELAFYVGCLNLHERLSAVGAVLCFPEPVPPDSVTLAAVGLRDASLVLEKGGVVVGNDLAADGKALIVVTGANSGGKSTFLRSLGLAQLMMQCGMFVTASSFRAATCEGLFTHFAREEDRTMTSGRLDEELGRMSVMADQLRPRCLALFNESFAATNEAEGSEIARQVVSALIDARVRVAFVTHQFDFARSMRDERRDSTLFLRAQRGPDGRRTFKLAPGEPLPTSFAADIYRRVGAWLEDGEEPPDVPVSPPTDLEAPRRAPVAGS